MKSKIKGPQQKTVLDGDVIVLRKLNMKKVPFGIREILAETNLEPGIHEQQMPWWEDHYISNDHPRDAMVSKFIMEATKSFAIARTDTGEILEVFEKDQLAVADRAVANAKVELNIDVKLAAIDDDEDPDLDDDDE